MIPIENHMSTGVFCRYAEAQDKMLSKAIAELETGWEHAPYVRTLLEESKAELRKLIHAGIGERVDIPTVAHERKIEKYTTWIEALRLASFQYGRYSSRRRSLSEGLYSTLLALSSQYFRDPDGKTIAVLGCGPGRSILDFALAYPGAEVAGMDYSLLSLIIARHILGDTNRALSIPVRDTTGEHYSELITIPGFSLSNCQLCLCDLAEPQRLCADLVVCSNTINLLPDHNRAVDLISRMLLPGGTMIYADLTGWRLDRHPEQTVLRSDRAIRECFANHGIVCAEMFSGGPYVEQETPENCTFYHEHFFVGQKDGKR